MSTPRRDLPLLPPKPHAALLVWELGFEDALQLARDFSEIPKPFGGQEHWRAVVRELEAHRAVFCEPQNRLRATIATGPIR